MSAGVLELLDATDTARRRVQHGAIAGGILLLLVERALLQNRPPGPPDLALIGLSLGLILVGMLVKQRWEVEFQGHRIRFENSPMFAERLFIDGKVVARGRRGRRIELRGAIKGAAGGQITAVSEARLASFRVQLFAEPSARARPAPMA